MNTQLQKQIFARIQGLDESHLREVLNFIDFLRFRGNPKPEKPGTYSHLRGKYKNLMRPSDEFAHGKAEEIQREEAKWKRKTLP